MPSRSRWVAVLAIVLLLFGVFVWPTQYRYERAVVGPWDARITVIVRISRITGKAEYLSEDGWIPMRFIR